VDLRDLLEGARAALLREQARKLRIENSRRMWSLGFWSPLRAAREIDPTLASVTAPAGTGIPSSSNSSSSESF
jgi:hypothetical protein